MKLLLIVGAGLFYLQIIVAQLFHDPFIQYSGHPMQVILDKPPPKPYDSQEMTEKDLLKIIMASQKGQSGGGGKGSKSGKQGGGKKGGKRKGDDSDSDEDGGGLAKMVGPIMGALGLGGGEDGDSGSNEGGIGDIIGSIMGGGSNGGAGGSNILGKLGGIINTLG